MYKETTNNEHNVISYQNMYVHTYLYTREHLLNFLVNLKGTI